MVATLGAAYDGIFAARPPDCMADVATLRAPALRPPALRAPTLRDQAYDSFTRHLLARDIRAGQFLSQRELVGLTGLPLGAIRELVPRLEAEGLIRTVPQRGMQVAHVDLSLIRDAFQFRQVLEIAAVASFAASASDDAIAQLRRDHAAILADSEAAHAGDGIGPALTERAQAIDWALHATIIDALGNAIIAASYRVSAIKIRLIKQEQTRLNDALVIPTMREHLAVIDAIAAREPAQALAALEAHITNARNRAMNLR